MPDLKWELLDRYLSGTGTASERERFEQWMAEDPENRRHVQGVLGALDEVGTEPSIEPLFDEEAVLRSLKRTIAEERRPSRWWRVAKIAASIAVVAGGAVGAWQLMRRAAPAGKTIAAARIVATPAGQRASFELPDGTRVILGVASTLSRSTDYGTTTRDVYLTGEAYFEVTHDEHRPFVVHAGDLVATDLGTQFVIRAYKTDPHGEVVVREGKVGVRAKNGAGIEHTIAPGQRGSIAANGTPVVQGADTSLAFAWTTGTLAFRDAKLRDALPQLGRWYDIQFRLADSTLGDITMSGRFKDRLTDDELDALAASVGLAQSRQGRVVTLRRIGGGSR